MAQYSEYNTTLLKVKRSEVQPGDIILGRAPSYLPPNQPLVRLPQSRERDIPPYRLQRQGYLRRTSSLDRGEFSAPYRGRDEIARRRTRRRDRPYEDGYDSEGPITRRRT